MMRRRFQRRHRTNADQPAGSRHHHPKKFSFGLLWIILALIVLVLVVTYDRRAINEAQQHIQQAEEYERSGLYRQALNEYKRAFSNKRLGRKPKARVALAIGDIYYDHFENYDMAHNYFVQAKQNAPKLLQDSTAQERLRLSQQRSAGAGDSEGENGAADPKTDTVIQRVELISAPQEDLRGPIVATLKGTEIRSGELKRLLREQDKLQDPKFRDDPKVLEEFLDKYLDKAILYQAGVHADLHRHSDVSRRLYEYQRDLIAERYLAQKRQAALVVPNQKVEEYYQANKARYVQPATVSVAMIKTMTAAAADEILQRLRNGEVFGDVATTASMDAESARNKGIIGSIKETDDTIPGVGKEPDVVKALANMKPNSVTGVTSIEGAFYIFKVMSRNPGRHTTLDEARPEIEAMFRGQGRDEVVNNLTRKLREEYQPKMERDNLFKFWQFADKDQVTSGPDTVTSASPQANLLPEAGKK